MKTILVVFAFLAIISGCNNRNPELENRNVQLERENSALGQDLASRDRYIDEITQEINEVYVKLESVRAKEKTMLKRADEIEAAKILTNADVRQHVKNQLSTISSELTENRTRINTLQAKIKSYKTQFAGLNTMVDNLKHTLEEREQALAEMSEKVKSLEQQVTEKTQLVSQRDSTISEQRKAMNTGYYAIGTRDELEKKGIIRKDGGFLWGLFGSTTILSSGFDESVFKPIDKKLGTMIEVSGRIDEILPKRSQEFYQQTHHEESHSTTLKIVSPEQFWQEKYLVIIKG